MIREFTIGSTIKRRLLINYRVNPESLAHFLPPPFRPQILGGVGIAGICLIRLQQLRPRGWPAAVGISTENAAHRVAVEWDGPDGIQRGVFIPRRDTSSLLTALVGGRLFPGEHHRARFRTSEDHGRYEVTFASLDGTAHVEARAKAVPELPSGSAFGSLAEASAFFQDAPIGLSPAREPGRFDVVSLYCPTWHVEPLLVEHVVSSFFENTTLFPAGCVEFDSALLMRDLQATWRSNRLMEVPVGPPRTYQSESR